MYALKKYPPVAAPLPPQSVSWATKDNTPVGECLAAIGDFLGVSHLYAVNSGRAALYAILKGTLADGSKVIVPGYTCYTVIAAIVKAGMKPVPVDSDPATLGYDMSKLSRVIEENDDIKAIIVCHLFGIGLDIRAIRKITGNEILIIDDAAQAMGSKVGSNMAGTAGHAGFYSFGRGKNLSMVGGGLLVSNDNSLSGRIMRVIESEFTRENDTAREIRLAKAYQRATHPYFYNLIARIPGVKLGQSVFDPSFTTLLMSPFKMRLLHKLTASLEKWQSERSAVAAKYYEKLKSRDDIIVPASSVDGSPGNLRFPVIFKDAAGREKILKRPEFAKYGLSTMYPTAVNGINELPELRGDKLPGAEHIANALITLPTHRHISSDDSGGKLTSLIAGLLQ